MKSTELYKLTEKYAKEIAKYFSDKVGTEVNYTIEDDAWYIPSDDKIMYSTGVFLSTKGKSVEEFFDSIAWNDNYEFIIQDDINKILDNNKQLQKLVMNDEDGISFGSFSIENPSDIHLEDVQEVPAEYLRKLQHNINECRYVKNKNFTVTDAKKLNGVYYLKIDLDGQNTNASVFKYGASFGPIKQHSKGYVYSKISIKEFAKRPRQVGWLVTVDNDRVVNLVNGTIDLNIDKYFNSRLYRFINCNTGNDYPNSEVDNKLPEVEYAIIMKR